MSPIKFLLAGAFAVAAAGAHAVPTYSIAAPSGAYGLPTSFTAMGNAGSASSSDTDHARPIGVVEGTQYLYTSYAGSSITIGVNAPSFSFLWGTPDAYNTVTYQTSLGDFSYTGDMLASQFGIANDGREVSTVFNATLAGGTINNVVFTSTDVAFEVAVAAVPEPQTYALMLAGLMAVGFMVRRIKR